LRDDLTTLLCERERPRSWDHYSNYRNVDKFERQYEDMYEFEDDEVIDPFTGVSSGSRESMKFRYGYDKKDFGEHLSPLYGVVRKNVGRKWDKVYSELNAAFDRRSATGDHIFQHLWDQLAKPAETFIKDGAVWVRGARFSSGGAELIRNSYYEFYVDPRDGILKRNAHRITYKQMQRQRENARKTEELKIRRVIDKDTELHCINGLWYEVKFRTFEGVRKQVVQTNKYSKSVYYRYETEYPYTFDVLKQKTVSEARAAVSKRSLAHKSLKQYGLAA